MPWAHKVCFPGHVVPRSNMDIQKKKKSAKLYVVATSNTATFKQTRVLRLLLQPQEQSSIGYSYIHKGRTGLLSLGCSFAISNVIARNGCFK